jgi:hypothetical protein
MDLKQRKKQLERQLQDHQSKYVEIGRHIEQLRGAIAIIDEQLKEQTPKKTKKQ